MRWKMHYQDKSIDSSKLLFLLLIYVSNVTYAIEECLENKQILAKSQ